MTQRDLKVCLGDLKDSGQRGRIRLKYSASNSCIEPKKLPVNLGEIFEAPLDGLIQSTHSRNARQKIECSKTSDEGGREALLRAKASTC